MKLESWGEGLPDVCWVGSLIVRVFMTSKGHEIRLATEEIKQAAVDVRMPL